MSDIDPKKVKNYDKINTKFGTVIILERKSGKITIMIDEDISATFNEKEFFMDFVI